MHLGLTGMWRVVGPVSHTVPRASLQAISLQLAVALTE